MSDRRQTLRALPQTTRATNAETKETALRAIETKELPMNEQTADSRKRATSFDSEGRLLIAGLPIVDRGEEELPQDLVDWVNTDKRMPHAARLALRESGITTTSLPNSECIEAALDILRCASCETITEAKDLFGIKE